MLTKQVNPTESLFGRAREAVIGILFGEPGARYHVREIARQAGLSAPTIAHELAQLHRAGVLKAEAVGNQLQFMANDQYPLAPELRSIAVKTWGVIGRVRAALSTRKDIEVAFVFGSYAQGSAGIGSDIDLLVMSQAPYGDYSTVAAVLSDELRRTVSLKLYRRAEWRRKLAESNPFVVKVREGPKLFLVGSEEDLDEGKESRGHARKAMDTRAPAVKGRGRRAPAGRARA